VPACRYAAEQRDELTATQPLGVHATPPNADTGGTRISDRR
jgi:hypothetical protein